jgi:hypothetical protein
MTESRAVHGAHPFTMDDVQLRAATDPEFRARLYADPRSALADAGIQLHPELRVRVVDQPKDELILPIPPAAQQATELDDDATAGIAAGSPPVVVGVVAVDALSDYGSIIMADALADDAGASGGSAAWTAVKAGAGVVFGGAAGWAADHL